MKNRINKQSVFWFNRISQQIPTIIIGLGLILIFSPTSVRAQEIKRIDKVKSFFADEVHSARKATIYSAILPGWGQAYNRKYWKIPIVYAGFAGVGIFIKTNHDKYVMYKSDYLLLEDDPLAQTASGLTNQAQIRQRIDESRRNRDLSIIGLALWYGLGLIDANVDGHFFNFDIDEDLSLGIRPGVIKGKGFDQGLGISINFTWR